MTRGFYTLGSGLITQNRQLSAISNNLANSKTNGFKKDVVVSTAFGDMVMNRIDSMRTPVGDVSMLRTVDISHTVHSQGFLEDTQRNLDFAIMNSGFFAIQGENSTVYSRNGSFNIDAEGYLMLQGVGRVLGDNGNPIQVGTDKIVADESGTIRSEAGAVLGKIGIYDFENYGELLTVGEGMYNGPNPTLVESPTLRWKNLEGSNVDVGQEMTNSIATQRILQSVSQAVKMYDTTLQAATTQIGRIQ